MNNEWIKSKVFNVFIQTHDEWEKYKKFESSLNKVPAHHKVATILMKEKTYKL